MRNVNDCDAGLLQLTNEGKQHSDLFDRECGRGFIKDDDTGVELTQTRDLQHLLFNVSEGVYKPVRVQA